MYGAKQNAKEIAPRTSTIREDGQRKTNDGFNGEATS